MRCSDCCTSARWSRGDVVYVPPGELHAIGRGVFLLELQQPEDLSILLEWQGFALDGERDGHLGLGFERALQAVTTRGRSTDEIDRWVGPGGEGASILPRESEQYFRLERHVVDGRIVAAPGFAVIVVEEGELTLATSGGTIRAPRGTTVAARHGDGEITATGDGTVLICRPPQP